eukprot:49878_1
MHIFAEYPLIKYICSLLGVSMIVCTGPFMGLTMGIYILWFIFIDNAQDKNIIFHPESNLSKYFTPYFSKLVRYTQDAFVVNLIIIEGILLPILFFTILYITTSNELSITAHISVWYCYNFIRIGPASQHFAYVHTLCHKEGHTHCGIFVGSFSKIPNNIFNFWIGLFYGLMPGYGPRDNIINYFAYIVQFSLYHTNLSSVVKFFMGGKAMRKYVSRIIFGIVYYWFFHMLVYYLSGYNGQFVFWYLTYPIFEAIIFLSAVNWSWHLFISPKDKSNQFVGSLTLLNGPGNVLHEDYHVVHHQYPAHHWSTHPQLFEKRRSEYIQNKASVFQQTHAMELFYFAVTKQYRKIAEKYDKQFLPNNIAMKEIEQLIKTRITSILY